MKLSPRHFLAFWGGTVYFALFCLMEKAVDITSLLYLFLMLFSGFVYVGYEKLLCLDTGKNKVYFKGYELYLFTVIVPLAVYACLSAFVGEAFYPAAIVSLGTAAYRLLWFAAEYFIKKGL